MMGRAVKAESMAPASSKLYRLLGEEAHQSVPELAKRTVCQVKTLSTSLNHEVAG